MKKNPVYHDQPLMFAPQMHWLADACGRLLVDWVGRFESLSADFDYLAATLELDGRLPHLKRSGRALYSDYYDSETVQHIYCAFHDDISAFGYKFQPSR